MSACPEWTMAWVDGETERQRVDCELDAPHEGEKHRGTIGGQVFEWWQGTSEDPAPHTGEHP